MNRTILSTLLLIVIFDFNVHMHASNGGVAPQNPGVPAREQRSQPLLVETQQTGHDMEAGGGGHGLLSLVIEKGKAYYLRQNLTIGGNDLDLLDEEKAKQYLAKYHKSILEEKHEK